MDDAMTGIDARRKKILMRSRRCGMHENDILVGKFAEAHIGTLDDRQLGLLETLLEQPDIDLFNWISGRAEVPEKFDCDVLLMIKKFN
ncbi:MAG: succinate dehydrogenase assembly factor 2, partial [Rhodospirillales bacterium]|nr:succinate dehydrogenase assembly factor 2 [Rhodospirillales bacterium]